MGRFLSKRPINLLAMKNTLASVRRHVKGVCITNIGANLYLFQLFHEKDADRIIRDGPSTFDQHLLILVLGASPRFT